MRFLLLVALTAATLTPSHGPGGTVLIDQDKVCTVAGTQQSTKGKCSISCSDTEAVKVTVGSRTHFYRCRPKLVINSFSPSTMYDAAVANLTLQVEGVNPDFSTELRCLIGSVSVSAVVNNNGVSCAYTPLAPGSYSLSVTDNYYDFSDSKTVEYRRTPRLISAAPLTGYQPLTVTITGSHLESSMQCVFNNISVDATVSSGTLACSVPTQLTGSVALSINANGIQVAKYSMSISTKWKMSAVKQTSVFGSSLGVFGSLFDSSVSVLCKVGSQTYSASIISNSYLTCNLAGLTTSGTYTLDIVTSDGSTVSDSQLTFKRVTEGYSLTAAKTSTLDLDLTISASFTYNDIDVYCKVGTYGPYKVTYTSKYSCPSSQVNDIGAYCIELSFNSGAYFSSDCKQTATFYRPTRVKSVTPTLLLVGETGSLVASVVKLSSGANYACTLSSGSALTTSTSTDSITCTIPDSTSSGDYNAIITQDSYYTLVQQPFTIKPQATLSSYKPQVVMASGSVINISGANLPTVLRDGTSVRCIFETSASSTSVTASEASTTSVTCKSPDVSSELTGASMALTVKVTQLNGTWTSALDITAYKSPTLSSIRPSHVFEGTYTTLVMDVTDLAMTTGLTVRGYCGSSVSFSASATYLYDDQLMVNYYSVACDPFNNSVVSFKLSLNGQDFYSEASVSLYRSPTQGLLSITKGPYIGGYDLEIYGSGFTNSIDNWCVFDTTEATAAISSTSVMKCTVPILSPGTAAISIRALTSYFTEKPQSFTLLTSFSYSINPREGPTTGSTLIELTGDFSLLSSQDTLQCKLGDSSVPALLVNSMLITCTSPAASSQGYHELKLIVNDFDISGFSSNKSFLYEVYPTLTNVSPSKVPSAASTLLTLTGTEFSSRAGWNCVWPTNSSKVLAFSSSQGVCFSPTVSSQTVAMKLSGNSQNVATSIDLVIYKDPSIYHISPLVGPRSGDTEVTLLGQFLEDITYCSFGGVKATSYDMTSTSVKCRTPPGSGDVKVEVSVNSYNFTTSDLTFRYYEYFGLTSVQPDYAPMVGGTTLTLTGQNFMSGMDCNFDGVKVQTDYVSSTNINCKAPAQTSSGRKYFSLSANQQQYHSFDIAASYVAYAAFADVSISQIYVTYLTQVKITATNLINNHDFTCKIGDVIADWIFRDDGSVICIMPQLPEGTYSIYLANNGVDFSEIGTLEYYSEVQVSYLDSTFQLLGGGYEVTVATFNIKESDGLACKFKLTSPYEWELGIASATYKSSSLLTCTSPASPVPGTVELMVSNDKQVWSGSSSATFAYIQGCRAGFYCTSDDFQVCPAGFACDGLRWYSPTPCEMGEYQDQQGKSYCKQCLPGTYCPERELDKPTDCPENTICPYYGLSYPYDDCPRGFICSAKTGAFLPSDESASYSRAGLCSAGQYCREGSIVETCTDPFYCGPGSTHYYGQVICPLAHFCKENVIQPCPINSYCSERGETLPIKCPPGTYNNQQAKSECTMCPIGYICPDSGMSAPETCPPGSVCNEEGLKAAVNKCKAGYFCIGGMETALVDRPCSEITDDEAKDPSFCGEDVMYLKEDPANVSDQIKQFANKVAMCCWSAEKTAVFLENIGANTTSTKAFTRAALNSKALGYTGVSLYSLTSVSSSSRRLQDTQSPDLELGLHLDSDSKLLDFWLYQVTEGKMAEMCQAGVFCLEGVASNIPDDSIDTPYICNPGTYCHAGASSPAGTALCPEGNYCPEGSSDPMPTAPGYSSSSSGSVDQSSCPLGYFTNSKSSAKCISCPNGYECNQSGTIWPVVCPPGTYRDSLTSNLCTNCPLETWSPDYALTNYTECLGCKAGRVCNSQGMFNITSSLPCSEGLYCDITNGISDRNCPAGFVCGTDTDPDEIYLKLCQAGFYCPEGTAERNQYLLQCPEYAYCPPSTNNYTIFYNSSETTDLPPTMCPDGTGRNSLSGMKSLLDCTITENYNTTTTGRRTLEASKFTVNVNPVDITLINATSYQQSDITTPLEGHEFIFALEPRNIAVVTIDLRHWSDSDGAIKYGQDWKISFTVKSSIASGENPEPIELPDSFLNDTINKSAVHEFELTAWDALTFKLNVMIFNGLIASKYPQFLNCTSVEVFTASRADYGTTKTFLTLINSDTALPVNLPRTLQDGVPRFLLSYSGNTQIKNMLIDNDNYYVPNSLYWGSETQQILPYLPYFSNCKGFGKYIPFWAIFELNKGCDLVDPSDTEPTEEFGFGTTPKADQCMNIELSCIYDEVPDDNQQVPRWWEQPLGTSVFFLSRDPISDDDFVNDPSSLDLIPVNTFQETSSGNLPSVVHLEVLYYQVDTELKRLVEANLYFEEFVELTSEQLRGVTVTDYQLKITMRALSHRELMIRFEFSLGFYTTLNLIVGFVSLGMTAVFVFYHRVLSKIEPKPNFKFWGYFVMMTPAPIKGMLYAVMPVFFVLVLVSVLVLGELFQANTTVDGKALMFDDINADYTKTTPVDKLTARYGRCGIAFLVIGIYCFALAINVFVPEQEKLLYDEDPSGNIWKRTSWRRAFTFFLSLIFVMFFVILIQVSFSSVFGDNIW